MGKRQRKPSRVPRPSWTRFQLVESKNRLDPREMMVANSRYTVMIAPVWIRMGPDEERQMIPMMHLSFRRNDRKPIRSWRDVQRMKSEICGSECEGVELYPAESRMMDGANQYHLWVLPPGIRFPFGIDTGRSVMAPGISEGLRAEMRRRYGVTDEDIDRGQQAEFEDGPDVGLNEPGMFPWPPPDRWNEISQGREFNVWHEQGFRHVPSEEVD